VRITGLAVEKATQAETAGAGTRHGRFECERRRARLRIGLERRIDAQALAPDAREIILRRIHVALVRDREPLLRILHRRDRELELAVRSFARWMQQRRLRSGRCVERNSDYGDPAGVRAQDRHPSLAEQHAARGRLIRTQVENRDPARDPALARECRHGGR